MYIYIYIYIYITIDVYIHYIYYVGIIGKVVTGGGLEWIYALLQTDQPLLIGEGLIALNIVAILPNGMCTYVHTYKLWCIIIRTDGRILLSLACSLIKACFYFYYQSVSYTVELENLNLVENSIW